MTTRVNTDSITRKYETLGSFYRQMRYHDEDYRGSDRELHRRTNLLTQDTSVVTGQGFPYETVAVIGCGGIGSWVSYFASKYPSVRRIVLIDPDILEEHNLNRTPFLHHHIGVKKVDALIELITSSNQNISIVRIDEYFDDKLIDVFQGYIAELNKRNGRSNELLAKSPWLSSYDLLSEFTDRVAVFDCRDNDFQDHNLIPQLFNRARCNIFRTAYNGWSVTLDYHPELHPIWGNSGYETVPSHIMPSSFAAQLALMAAETQLIHTSMNLDTKQSPITIDIGKFFAALLANQAINTSTGLVPQHEIIYNLIPNKYVQGSGTKLFREYYIVDTVKRIVVVPFYARIHGGSSANKPIIISGVELDFDRMQDKEFIQALHYFRSGYVNTANSKGLDAMNKIYQDFKSAFKQDERLYKDFHYNLGDLSSIAPNRNLYVYNDVEKCLYDIINHFGGKIITPAKKKTSLKQDTKNA